MTDSAPSLGAPKGFVVMLPGFGLRRLIDWKWLKDHIHSRDIKTYNYR